MRPSLASADRTGIDPDSRVWLESLGTDGPSRERAIERLHALLLRAARYEVARRRDALRHLDHGELDDIAVQSADDALLAILSKLDQFRGNSRFTSWAYKFALLETAVKLRRRPWQEREIPVDPDAWPRRSRDGRSPQADAEQAELLTSVGAAIQTELTPHQREILVAIALNGVPIDVLAERLGTTRGALYKTIHDARLKLRRRLHAEGHQVDSELEGAHGG
jgi:RNA polymerase sigma-70 factor (ECF subfamily)